MTSLEQAYARVRRRIRDAETRAGRRAGGTALLAVSKGHPAAAIRALAACGQRRFGENRLDEAAAKMPALADLPIEWHFIGALQSNKTRGVAERFAWVHGVDRLRIAERLDAQRPRAMPPLQVCLQVNISGEASKSGVRPERIGELAAGVAALPRLRLRGLMTIPAPAAGRSAQRAPFARLRALMADLVADGYPLDTLSMGMSADLEAAIAEQATIVRVGTALFGPRRPAGG